MHPFEAYFYKDRFQTMITCKVIRRYIQPLPLQDAIMRTDALADTVCFEIVNFQENVDFSTGDWQWFVYYKTSIDPPTVVPVKATVSEDGNLITVRWVIDHFITSREGSMDFQLRAKSDTSEGFIKWNSSVCTINIGHSLDPDNHDTDENILEWYLDRMEQLAQNGALDLIAERERAMEAEVLLDAKITGEIERSTEEDVKTDNEILAINDSLHEMDEKIDEEVNRSVSKDIELDKKIDSETERAEQKELELESAVNDERNRALEAETNLQTNINAEVNRALQAETNLQLNINAETERAKQAEQELRDIIGDIDGNIADKLNEEIARATARENELDAKIDTETERATQRETELEGMINDANASILAETERAIKAESDLSAKIDSETARAEGAEKTLQDNIDETNTALQDETDRATGREDELQSLIEQETNRATLAEENLSKDIEEAKQDVTDLVDAETARAKEAEATLQQNIDDTNTALQAEVTRATAREEALDKKIDETSNSLNANIRILQEDLTEEKQTRENETRTLNEGLASANLEISTLKTGLETETNAREDADSVLQGEIDSIQIIKTNNPTPSVSARYNLQITKEGMASVRGADIDIPVTDAVTSGEFDDETGNLILYLANGDSIEVPIGDLVQYYDAGQGIEIQRVDETHNRFVIKLSALGTQGILSTSTSDGGLSIDLSSYFNRTEVNNLLSEKQDKLLPDTSGTNNYYPPITVDSTNVIHLKSDILTDLGIAFEYANDARGWVLNLANTTINGQAIGTQSEGEMLGKTIRLYEPLEGITPPTAGNVLIAGNNGAYKDSTFTLGKSVPADAKFTDTTYDPVSETVEEGLFTRTEQIKLEGIEEGAQKNVQADWDAVDGDAFILNKPGVATETENGLMGSADRTKLDGIEEGAEKNQNAFSSITVGDSSVPAGASEDSFTLVGEGGTSVSADPVTKTITIRSEDTAQPDWTEQDEESPAYIANRPDWVKGETKPEYTADEVGALPLAGGTMTGTINSQNVIPTANNAYDLGSDANRQRNVYVANAVYLGSPADGKGIFFNSETGGFDFVC